MFRQKSLSSSVNLCTKLRYDLHQLLTTKKTGCERYLSNCTQRKTRKDIPKISFHTGSAHAAKTHYAFVLY